MDLRQRLGELAGLALDPGRLRAQLALIADQLPSWQDIKLLEGELVPQLTEAAVAATLVDQLRRAIVNHDADAFLKLWHETWHPLLPRTASLVPAARRMLAGALSGSTIKDVSMVRLGDDLVRLSWRWRSQRPRDRAGKGSAATGTEILTIAVGDRQSPDELDNAQHVVTVFRSRDDDTAAVEMTWSGDRMAAALFSGHVIAGRQIHARQPIMVAEPRRSLAYRFQAATFRERDDWLLIRSPHSLLAPALRIVHARSGRTISTIERQRLHSAGECAVNLSQLRASSQDSARWLRAMQRFLGDESLCYRLVLDDPSDQDWIEILHPVTIRERQLSFLWQERAVAAAFA
jgi:hypothetical protein